MRKTQRRLLLGLLVPLGAALIFILPWYVPQFAPIASDSYTFGFSNITADLGVAVILALLLIWRFKDDDSAGQQETLFDLLTAKPRGRRPWLPWLATFAGTVFAAGVAGGWWLFLPKAYFGESTYFLARLDRMLMGQKPFRDFDFGYGPLLLDAPFLLHKVCAGWLAIDTSYILCLLASFVLGILALSYVVRSLAIPDWLKAVLILGFSVANANITLGIIYTPLRYIFPLWAVMVYQRRVRDDVAEESILSFTQVALAFALPLAGFGICPDTGVVTLLGIVVGSLWFWQTAWRAPMLGALAAAASLGVIAALYGASYFQMLLLFGGGAYNFPIFPAPYILIFLGCVFHLLPDLGVIAMDEEGVEAPLFASVLVVLGLFIPSALGRCDPGHVFENGLGILLLAAASLGSSAVRWRRAVCVAGAFILLATIEAASWNNGKPALRYIFDLHRQVRANPGAFDLVTKRVAEKAAGAPAREIFDWSKQTPLSEWFLDLLPYDKVGLPLGGAEDVDRFLKLSGRYIPEYSVAPFGGTFTAQSLRRKLADLQEMNMILVPRIYFRHLEPLDKEAYAKGACETMQGLFLFPVHLSVANEPLEPEAVVMRRIAHDFVRVTLFDNYLLMRRKTVFEQ